MPDNPRVYVCCNKCGTAAHSTDYDTLWRFITGHQERFPGHKMVEEKTGLAIDYNTHLLGDKRIEYPTNWEDPGDSNG